MLNTKDLLQSAEVKIISNNICNKWLEQLYGRSNDINKHMICAGYKEGKKDACQVSWIEQISFYKSATYEG